MRRGAFRRENPAVPFLLAGKEEKRGRNSDGKEKKIEKENNNKIIAGFPGISPLEEKRRRKSEGFDSICVIYIIILSWFKTEHDRQGAPGHIRRGCPPRTGDSGFPGPCGPFPDTGIARGGLGPVLAPRRCSSRPQHPCRNFHPGKEFSECLGGEGVGPHRGQTEEVMAPCGTAGFAGC